MADTVIRIHDLPNLPLDAAQSFFADFVPEIRDNLRAQPGQGFVIVFERTGREHRGWQLSAVQDLAREAAPGRVNGVVGGEEQAVAQTLAWLEQAPGVTGQLLPLDATGAGISEFGAI